MSKIFIISGPTASGKSDLAMKLAEKMDAVIINADSQQVYQEIPILTAQPSRNEKNKIPHELYGFMSVTQRCSAALWMEKVKKVIDDVLEQEKTPILVGGTGLYLRCLMHGIAAIPEIAAEIQEESRALLNEVGVRRLHEMLSERDPEMGEKLDPEDSQRITRAWEVISQTGTSIDEWQKKPHKVFYKPEQFEGVFLNPPREELYAQINRRFIKMVGEGALDEIKKMDEMKLDESLPAMKAQGAPELLAHIRGEVEIGDAIEKAQQHTRNYAKRQVTWFRNQMPELEEITNPDAIIF